MAPILTADWPLDHLASKQARKKERKKERKTERKKERGKKERKKHDVAYRQSPCSNAGRALV